MTSPSVTKLGPPLSLPPFFSHLETVLPLPLPRGGGAVGAVGGAAARREGGAGDAAVGVAARFPGAGAAGTVAVAAAGSSTF